MKKIKFHDTIKVLSLCLLLFVLAVSCKNKKAPQVPPNEETKSSETVKVTNNSSTISAPQAVIEKKSEPNKKVEETQSETSPISDKPSTLFISFYSIGGGIDVKSAQSFDNFISGYKTKSDKTITYDRVPWGREGELDYCVSFAGLNANEIDQFIEASKVKIQDCKMVHFKINGECKRKR